MSSHQKPDEKVVYVGDSRVRKNTKTYVPRDYSAYPGKSEAFVPNFLLKEWMVGAVVLVGFMALIIAHEPPLGYPADPTNTSFIPMPDWYFLFLYQLLKYPYTSDDFLVFGTVVLPGLAFGGLLLAPFLDTGKERRWYKRPVASSLMFVSLIAIVYLTYVSWDHYQHELEKQGIVPEHIKRAEEIRKGNLEPGTAAGGEEEEVAIVDENAEGYDIYQRSTCVACHAADMNGQANAPGLRGIGDKYSREELVQIMKEGIPPYMPAEQWQASIDAGLTEEEMNTLADWLAKQKTGESGNDESAGEASEAESH